MEQTSEKGAHLLVGFGVGARSPWQAWLVAAVGAEAVVVCISGSFPLDLGAGVSTIAWTGCRVEVIEGMKNMTVPRTPCALLHAGSNRR